MAKIKNIVISGWYGHGNIGDEAILQALIEIFEKKYPGCTITALSFSPEYTKKTQNINAVKQFPIGKKKWLHSVLTFDIVRTLIAIYKCDLFVMGGGGFLSDWQPYVPHGWLKQMKIAKYFGKKTWLYRIGAGPFLTDVGKKTTKFYIDNFVDMVSVRDKESYRQLVENVGIEKRVEIEIDPVANMSVDGYIDRRSKQDSKYICIIYTEYFKNKYFKNDKMKKWDHLFRAFCAQIEAVIDKGLIPKLLFFQKDIEESLAKKFVEVFNEQIIVLFPQDYKDAFSMMSESKGVISFRLHGNIMAYAIKKPFLPIIYHHKTAGFLELIDFRNNEYLLEVGDGENWKDVVIDSNEWKSKTEIFLESIK